MAFKLTNTPFPLTDGKSRERKNQEAASRAVNLSLPQAKSIKQINKDPNI